MKEKPKICGIDLEQEIIEALITRGLDCYPGTFGSPVQLPIKARGDKYRCQAKYNFPSNLHEYDIIIVDLKKPTLIEYRESEHTESWSTRCEETILLSRYPQKIFNPRPLSSKILGINLQDFFSQETLIIIFCSTEEVSEYYPVTITDYDYYPEKSFTNSLYDFMPFFAKTKNKTGKKVNLENSTECITNFLQKYSNSFVYEVIFEHPTEQRRVQGNYTMIKDERFCPLLLNSNNEIIGFIDFRFSSSKVFAFPQLKNKKKDFLLDLLDDLLPSLFPKIFPYSEQFSWVNSSNYFLPNQESLLDRKLELEKKYNTDLAEVNIEIEKNKYKYQFLHDLITETGDDLVKSVEHFLVWLGFNKPINMDETNPEIKEEDIQVVLQNGLLVIEIKGISGTSKDNECSQVSKIKYRRAKERGKFDVYALYIVNHQRFLPPLERKNPPFSEQQIDDADLDERGLLTTYELFKLYKNIEQGFITKEDARTSLLEFGLVHFKPSNSDCLGFPLEIHHNGQVLILSISDVTINKGASIIVCDEKSWFRAKILEIQLNGEEVKTVSNGEIGIKLSHSVSKISKLWLENDFHE